MSNFSFTQQSYQPNSSPYLQPIPSLGTSGRTSAAVIVGSSRGGAGSSSRVASWQRVNLTLPGTTPSNPSSVNGGYGGGGGGGAPQFKANGAGNGYSGGNGGQGLVCIWANINQTNTTPSISGIAASPLPTIPPPSPGTSATLNVISANTNNISSNSAYPNSSSGVTSVVYNGETYYVIFLGPGDFTIETNLSVINIAMCGGGGGGAGGPSLENDKCVLGAGGGGGGAIIAGTIILYEVESNLDNNLGLTSTIQVSVGYGGAGGAGGYKYPSSGQNYIGFGGSTGNATQVTISQTTNSQISQPIYFGCPGGQGGTAASNNTSSGNGTTPPGGSGGTPNVTGFSTEGYSLIFAFLSGGNGGNGTSSYNVTCTGNDASYYAGQSSIIPDYSYQVFSLPAYNCTIPYQGSTASYSATFQDSAAAINMGGGGAGSYGYTYSWNTNVLGGDGAGGTGGSVSGSAVTSSGASLNVFDWLAKEVIGVLGLDDPATYVSLIFEL
jgi:hypothetical protein